MPRELSKSYNPGEIEAPLYKEWCEKGYFTPSPDKNNQHFISNTMCNLWKDM